MFPPSPQNLRPQRNSGSTPSTKINSVDQAIQRVNSAPITSSSDAMVALRTLSALPYTDYSIKVAAHSQLIQTLYSSLDPGEKVTFDADVKKYYTDHPYLGSQVSAKLPADQKQAIFGNAAGIKFESTLYAELKNSPISYAPTETIAARIAAQEAPAQTQNSVSSIANSPKEIYLNGIRTTAMLGNHELQPLANLIGRPIVVVRAEPRGLMMANNVEVIAYPEGRAETTANAVFVLNIGNCHFRTFTPTHGTAINAGSPLPGIAEEGDYAGAGTNDCLIASIKHGGGDFGKLTNLNVREHCATYQITHGHADNYVVDVEFKGQFIDFKAQTDIPPGFTGHVIIKPSEDSIHQGQYNGGRVGEWSVSNNHGLFKVDYDEQHHPIQIVQEGKRGTNSEIERFQKPIVFANCHDHLHLISGG